MSKESSLSSSKSHPDYRKAALFEHIDHLRTLEQDWDSYGARPITEPALEAAKKFVSGFRTIPTTGSGVAFEVRFGQVEINVEFDDEGRVESAWLCWERDA